MTAGSDLQDLLAGPLRRDADRIALRHGDQQLSYGQLHELVCAMADGLRRHGVGASDRVAWLLPNRVEAVLAVLACYRIGAVAVPLNYRYVADEARDVLERTAARLVIFDRSRAPVVRPFLDANPDVLAVEVAAEATPGSIPFEDLLRSSDDGGVQALEQDEPALILFTSGSTGRPKGVVHSHRSTYHGIDISRQVFDFTARDIVLVGKSISHAGGLQTQMLPAFQAGAEVILAMRPTPAEAVELISAHGASQYGLLASDLLDFVEYLEAGDHQLPTLRNAIGSGDSVPVDLHHRFRDVLGWEVMEGAGMTEVGTYYAVNPRYGGRKWGSVGRPPAETRLRIVSERGHDCAIEEVGEILVDSPSSTIGYWQDARATAELLSGGWLHTGDLARMDEDGYVWFVGRKKVMIVRRGSNIAPAEVEDVLDEHPLVHASVVVGVNHPRDGQVPAACVVLLDPDNADPEALLRDYAAAHLAAYKCPVYYLFLDELPRTSTGKFDRHGLQEMAHRRFDVSPSQHQDVAGATAPADEAVD